MKRVVTAGGLALCVCALAILVGNIIQSQPAKRDLNSHAQLTVSPNGDMSSHGRNWEEYSSIPANDLKGAEDVPLYPNAEHVTKDDILTPWSPITKFESTESVQDVAAFYRTTLAKSGWKLDQEKMTEYGLGLDFVWTSDDLLSRYKLLFIVSLGIRGGRLGDLTQGSTDAYTRITRWPFASRIPLYPGAQQIEEKDVLDEYGFTERVTRYQACATPHEVEAYYLRILPEYGWGFVEPQYRGDKDFQGLVFSFDSGGTETPKYSALFLTATANSEGQTVVEMRATGDDIPQLEQR